MSVSLPGPGWCPETSNEQHSGAWYDGGKCAACGQDGPEPDDYFWPDSSGPLFPAAALETIEDRVARYVAATGDRDQLVKDLKAEGWGPTRISRALGLGRATIGRILGATWTQDHGRGYKTAPRDVSHETSRRA